MENNFIKVLFGKRKFPIIIAKSVIITVAFFIAVDAFTNVIKKDVVLFVFSLLVFYAIFMVYVIDEVKKNEK